MMGPMEGPAKGLRQNIPRWRQLLNSGASGENEQNRDAKLTHSLSSPVHVPDITQHCSSITDRYRGEDTAEESNNQQSRQIGD